MSETNARNPVTVGVLVAVVGLIIAGGLGALLMWIGSNRLETAKRTEQPYHLSFAYIAQDALTGVTAAESALKANNWGQAQTALDEAGKAITTMERAASEADAQKVRDARAALGEAQTAIGKQDPDAPERVADLRRRLEALAAEK